MHLRNILLKHIKLLNIPYEKTTIENYKVKLLKRILKNTAKILSDQKVYPKSESEIQKTIHNYLVNIFPDIKREVSIGKVLKTFKPDFGIPSLKKVSEYKFVKSKEEANKVIGGIYEGCLGYSGRNDWNRFFAIIFMNDFDNTNEQIEEEIKMSNDPDNWEFILTIGLDKKSMKLNPASYILSYVDKESQLLILYQISF